MPDSAHPPLAQPRDLAVAFALLTRLKVPVDHAQASLRGAHAGWAYPLVGAIVGATAGFCAILLEWFGISAGISAVLALTILVVLTGAMHEDGLADCADGMGAGPDRNTIFAAMRDSHIGAFGTIALVLALLARWSGVVALDGWGLVIGLAAAGAISRAIMFAAMAIMPNARSDGLSASAGQPQPNAVWLALGIALLIALFAGWSGIGALIFALLAALPVAVWASNAIGGQTGDVLGAVQQCAEIGALAVLATALRQ